MFVRQFDYLFVLSFVVCLFHLKQHQIFSCSCSEHWKNDMLESDPKIRKNPKAKQYIFHRQQQFSAYSPYIQIQISC